MTETRYSITTTGPFGSSTFVVWVRPGETIEGALVRQFPSQATRRVVAKIKEGL